MIFIIVKVIKHYNIHNVMYKSYIIYEFLKYRKDAGMFSAEKPEIPEKIHRWVHFNKCIFRWECFRRKLVISTRCSPDRVKIPIKIPDPNYRVLGFRDFRHFPGFLHSEVWRFQHIFLDLYHCIQIPMYIKYYIHSQLQSFDDECVTRP